MKVYNFFFFQYEFFCEMTIKVKMNNQTSLVDTMLGIIVQLKKKDNSFS